MSNKNKQIRQGFTLEFKQSAAKLVNEKGCSQQPTADSLGVLLRALSRWVRAGGESLFLRKIFPGSCSKNQQKITRPPMPSAAPIRPRHLVSPQQGVET